MSVQCKNCMNLIVLQKNMHLYGCGEDRSKGFLTDINKQRECMYFKTEEEIREEAKEELRECFEVLKNEKITVEYIKLLGKVCTYYGYSLDDLKERLIKKEDINKF